STTGSRSTAGMNEAGTCFSISFFTSSVGSPRAAWSWAFSSAHGSTQSLRAGVIGRYASVMVAVNRTHPLPWSGAAVIETPGRTDSEYEYVSVPLPPAGAHTYHGAGDSTFAFSIWWASIRSWNGSLMCPTRNSSATRYGGNGFTEGSDHRAQ